MTGQHSVEQKKQRVAFWSLLASLALAIGKLGAAVFSGSLGLLSEAFHSMVDTMATAVTLAAIRYADRPADEDHHYGHAKMESVAALLETGLLIAVTAWVVYEAITRLLTGGSELELGWWIFAVVGASIVIDWNRSRALQTTADATQSDALAADALHFRADMWSSCAVMAGLALALAGWKQADSVAALVVALFVARAAWDLGRRTLATLVDAAPSGLASLLSQTAADVHGVLSVDKLRVRPAGPTLFVEMSINVPRTVHHSRMLEIKSDILQRIRDLQPSADVNIVAVPVEIDDETALDKIMHIAASMDAAIHHVTVQDNNGKLAISFDYEVEGTTPLLEAHDSATLLEIAVRNGLGTDVEVESHIEPRPPVLLHGTAPAKGLQRKIETSLKSLVKKERFITDLHNIRIRATEEGLFVHYHCRFAPETMVQKVHDIVDRVESRLSFKIKGIARVVAHAEPLGSQRHRH